MKFSISTIAFVFLVATSIQAATTRTSPATSSVTPRRPGAIIKRGLSFNNVRLTNQFNSSTVSWAYNWDSAMLAGLPAGVTFFPMLWNAAPQHANQWSANAKAAIARGATHLLFINEPDLGDQGNTTPQAAAAQWMQYKEPFHGQATLVSPAVTNGPPPAMGKGWLDAFLAECAKLGCHVDAIAGHIYDSATNVGYYQNYVKDFARYNRPLLLTEFGASGSQQQQQAFLNTMVPFLDGQAHVSHYAWFMTAVGNLVNGDGTLTPLGQVYISA